MQIMGNGRTFRDAEDLTDETHDEILTLFEQELTRPDIVRHDPRTGERFPVDAFAAALRCVIRVRREALAQGWTPECAESLATVAGHVYAGVISEARKEAR
jgi:hypothetical protein